MTIVAIATPNGAGGIGVIRISGPSALVYASAVFSVGKNGAPWIAPTHALMTFGRVHTREFSDEGYAVYFKAPHSYTGEDVVELHLHGGVRILQGVTEAILAEGAVMAEAGEFTRRAFLNGKLDLTAAEGVIDMINAQSAAAVRAAYSMSGGALCQKLHELRTALVELIADMEVVLDYPEETEDEVMPAVKPRIAEVRAELKALADSFEVGKRAKNGLDCAIVGRPNVGKSSLLNRILGRTRAIVSEHAGTTRDLVGESFEYRGVRLNLLDSAGLRDTEDEIEQIGVEYAKSAAQSADFVIYVEDDLAKLKDSELFSPLLFQGKTVLKVLNKCDRLGGISAITEADIIPISAKTGEGVNALLERLVADYNAGAAVAGKYVISSMRHYSLLLSAISSLQNAEKNYDGNFADCILIDLNEALYAVSEITGDTAAEAVIDSVFSRFCVGK